jgi:hypothetical protein
MTRKKTGVIRLRGNAAALADQAILAEFLIAGCRNRDMRVALYGAAQDTAEIRCQAGRVSRQLALLCAPINTQYS